MHATPTWRSRLRRLLVICHRTLRKGSIPSSSAARRLTQTKPAVLFKGQSRLRTRCSLRISRAMSRKSGRHGYLLWTRQWRRGSALQSTTRLQRHTFTWELSCQSSDVASPRALAPAAVPRRTGAPFRGATALLPIRAGCTAQAKSWPPFLRWSIAQEDADKPSPADPASQVQRECQLEGSCF